MAKRAIHGTFLSLKKVKKGYIGMTDPYSLAT